MSRRKLSMPLALLFLCFFSSIAAPQNAPPPLATMSFTLSGNGGNCIGCEWIAADGPITERTPNDFRKFLSEHSSTSQIAGMNVVLNSGGGNLVAGLLLGEIIHQHRYWTSIGKTVPQSPSSSFDKTVAGKCLSACAYAFLGGRERFVEDGEIGFHQFYNSKTISDPLAKQFTSSDVSDAQLMVGIVALYLKKVEADPEVLFIASRTQPQDMHRPSKAELERLRITTSTGTSFSGWQIEPHRGGGIVTGVVRYSSVQEHRLSVFCRRSAPGRVFIASSPGNWVPQGSARREASEGLRASMGPLSLRVGQRSVEENQPFEAYFVNDTQGYIVAASLNTADFSRGLLEGIKITIDVPGYLGHVLDLTPPLNGLRERIQIALRSCVAA